MIVLSYGLMGLLMVSGLLFLVEQAAAWLWRPKELPLLTLVLPLKGNMENVEQLVRHHINCMRWQTPEQRWRILLLDQGMEESTRERCLCLSRSVENITIVKEEKLKEQF